MTTSHHKIRESLLKRIQAGEWELGNLIPGELQLAEEYGCARTTVNRAVRALAEQGLVIRKRKGGTRIRKTPLRQAKLDIPIIREQVESTGQTYRHNIVAKNLQTPPAAIQTRLRLSSGVKALHIETLHLADERPFAFEARWLNTNAVPGFESAPLDELSINEWLVKTVPFSNGDVTFSAINADKKIASALDCNLDQALLLIDRTTWLGDTFITAMKLYHKENFQLYSKI